MGLLHLSEIIHVKPLEICTWDIVNTQWSSDIVSLHHWYVIIYSYICLSQNHLNSKTAQRSSILIQYSNDKKESVVKWIWDALLWTKQNRLFSYWDLESWLSQGAMKRQEGDGLRSFPVSFLPAYGAPCPPRTSGTSCKFTQFYRTWFGGKHRDPEDFNGIISGTDKSCREGIWGLGSKPRTPQNFIMLNLLSLSLCCWPFSYSSEVPEFVNHSFRNHLKLPEHFHLFLFPYEQHDLYNLKMEKAQCIPEENYYVSYFKD